MTDQRRAIVLLFVAALLTIAVNTDISSAPLRFTHQGRLTDASNQPVTDAIYSVTYRLFADSTGGIPVWTETVSVSTENGLFSALLGQSNPLDLDIFGATQLYLEVQFGGDSPILPRTLMTPSVYAGIAQRIRGDVNTEPGQLLIVPAAINKGIRLVATDAGAGIDQWDSNDSSAITPAGMKIYDRWGELIWEAMELRSDGMTFVDSLGDTTLQINGRWGELIFETNEYKSKVTPTGMKIYDRWGELIWEAMELRSDGMILTDSLGDTTLVLRSQDDGIIRTFTWTQMGGPPKSAIRDGAGPSGSYSSYRAMTDSDSSGLDIFIDTADVVLEMNKAELIDAMAKEARIRLSNDGTHLNLGAFRYSCATTINEYGIETVYVDSSGDTSAVWRSNDQMSQISLGTDGGVEVTNNDSTASLRIFDRQAVAGYAEKKNDPIPGIDIIVQKIPDGPVRKIVVGPSSGFNGIVAVSDTTSALLRIGGGDKPAVTSVSDGTTARLSLDGRSSFDPNGGAIAVVASPSGCALMVMNGPSDTTLQIDQSGNIRADGTVSIGTPEQLAALTVAGDICATGTIGACSDERFKRDVRQLEDALTIVSQLRGVAYRWKQGEFQQKHFDSGEHIGFVAQELASLLPQVVSQTTDGYFMIDYGKLTPLLVEAIKDLSAQKNEQADQISELSERLRKLEVLLLE